MQKSELELKQRVDQQELMKKQLEATIKEDQMALKAIQTDIDKERSSGKAVWETVGISTVSYRDPFHTGLSKRTPTGACMPCGRSAHARVVYAPCHRGCRPRHASRHPLRYPIDACLSPATPSYVCLCVCHHLTQLRWPLHVMSPTRVPGRSGAAVRSRSETLSI
jgi:hypothetical protein